MKKVSSSFLALIIGSVLEGGIVVLALVFADFGRCMNPTNIFADFILFIHWPGVIAARLLQPPDSHGFDYAIIVGTTTVLWSVVAFALIGIVRGIYGRKTKPAA
jgi:hypothetical protein